MKVLMALLLMTNAVFAQTSGCIRCLTSPLSCRDLLEIRDRLDIEAWQHAWPQAALQEMANERKQLEIDYCQPERCIRQQINLSFCQR